MRCLKKKHLPGIEPGNDQLNKVTVIRYYIKMWELME